MTKSTFNAKNWNKADKKKLTGKEKDALLLQMLEDFGYIESFVGGGGGSYYNYTNAGGDGGSGCVVIRYKYK